MIEKLLKSKLKLEFFLDVKTETVVRQVRQTFLGQMVQTAPCPTCGGRGETIASVCKTCRGGGLERKRFLLELECGVAKQMVLAVS